MINIQKVQNDIQVLEEQIEKGKILLSKAEGKLETLEKQKEDLLTEIKRMGFEPSQLEAEIGRLEQEIVSSLTEIQKLVPESLR